MTDDVRVARSTAEPSETGPSGAARWSDYLDWVRAEVCRTVLALPEADQRIPRVPSGWTPLEMLSHCLHMEQRWFVWGFLGEQVAEPWGDWDTEDPGSAAAEDEPRPRWVVRDDATAAQLVERLEGVAERTRTALREHPLAARAASGGRFTEDPPTLEWICFHVLAEYARHAGHLDIVAELTSS